MMLRHALRMRNDSTDRFWRVTHEGTDVVTFYGRTGTTGKVLLRRFATEADCRTQVERDIRAKVTKGYVALDDAATTAAFDAHRYTDDRTFGLHRLTSHPRFVQVFSDPLYQDPHTEDAPFGNDAGHDALTALQEDVQADVRSFPERLVREHWGMTFVAPAELTAEQAQDLVARRRDGAPRDRDSYQSDQVVVATACGQAKITGQIDPELCGAALLALARLVILNEAWSGRSYPQDGVLHTVARDLRRFG